MTRSTSPLPSLWFAALAAAALARPIAAQPMPPTPPGPPADGSAGGRPPPPPCTPGGAPIFAIAHRYDGAAPDAARHVTSVARLDANGAWTVVTTLKGKSSATSGCVTQDQLASVEHDLAAADWKMTTQRVHCMARSNEYATYTVAGDDVYTARLCESPKPDASSQQAIDAMNQLAATFVKGPPCCKH